MKTLTLYLCQFACSMAPHIALKEAGAEFSTVHVALGKGEQFSEAYRKINPHAQVPVLKTGDEVLTENVAIAYWIDKTFPNARLIPARTPDEKAQVLSYFAWLNSSVHPAFGSLYHPERFVNSKDAQAELKKHGRETVSAYLNEINRRLDDRVWVFREFSIVDCYLFVFAHWAEKVFHMDLAAHFPNLHAHYERMLARPSVRQVFKDEAELAAAA